jgi:hypothetical protein
MEQQKMNQGRGEKMNHFVGERKNNGTTEDEPFRA